MKNLLAIVMSILIIGAFGCTKSEAPTPTPPSQDTIDRMRESIEDAAEGAADAAEDALEKAGEAVDSAGQAIGDAIENITGGDN